MIAEWFEEIFLFAGFLVDGGVDASSKSDPQSLRSDFSSSVETGRDLNQEVFYLTLQTRQNVTNLSIILFSYLNVFLKGILLLLSEGEEVFNWLINLDSFLKKILLYFD